MNVDEMLGRITLEQFYEWMRFEALEPFGFPLVDQSQARVTWAVLKATASNWKGRPEDFSLRPPTQPREVEVDPVEFLTHALGVAPPPRPPDGDAAESAEALGPDDSRKETAHASDPQLARR